MSSESKRLKNFFLKIIIFTAFIPLCYSFAFLYYIIKLNQDKLSTYHAHEVYKTELAINNFLTRSVDSLHKIINAHELKEFLNSNFNTETFAKQNLQSLFNQEKSMIAVQEIFYCIYGSQGGLLYGEKFCPKNYQKRTNNRVFMDKDDQSILLNASHVFKFNFSTQIFFSAVIPFSYIRKMHPSLEMITFVSDSIDQIQIKAFFKTDTFHQQIELIFYIGMSLFFVISLCSIIYGIKITHSLKNKAEESLKLATIGKMAHVLAHDIKKPFLNFSNFTNEIVLCKTQEERDHLIQSTQKSIQSSQLFIEKLLNELMQGNESSLNVEQNIPLIEIIKSCFETFSNEDRAKIDLQIRLNHTLSLNGDILKLKRVFLNLISNAQDAIHANQNPKNNQLIIKSLDHRGYLRIMVYNSIELSCNEQLNHIFEPFFTTKQHGAGLGLFIAKRIVELHKGKIFYSKKLDGFSIFIDLPGTQFIANSKIHPTSNLNPIVQEKYIFLIDDCPLTLRMWKRNLTEKYSEFKILEFLNFEDFFDFIHANNIHHEFIKFIILDYIFNKSSNDTLNALVKIREFYSKKIYISTHMDFSLISNKLDKFYVHCIDKNLMQLT